MISFLSWVLCIAALCAFAGWQIRQMEARVMPKGFVLGICPTCGKPLYQRPNKLAKPKRVNQPSRRKVTANKGVGTYAQTGITSHAEASGIPELRCRGRA